MSLQDAGPTVVQLALCTETHSLVGPPSTLDDALNISKKRKGD
jgi:hypothetical protein